MPPRSSVRHLKLGPVVGHTDHSSSRIWIQAFDDPANYELLVQGAGRYAFIGTEAPGQLEFRTGIAVADGLKPDWRYRYRIMRLGRSMIHGSGTFRTMPDPVSMANLTFLAISCNVEKEVGAWKALGKYIADAQPQFLLMVGDQLYLDEGDVNLFDEDHRNLPRATRRKQIAEKYKESWSPPRVRDVLANIPVYMMWDDHDIRDGWGSSPYESPTLLELYPRGVRLHETSRAYFEDCRDAYWHFQACHNPPKSSGADPSLPNYVSGPPPPGSRQAMPYVFRCGRLMVLMLDSRGERDVFRAELPILGATQWQFIETVFANLPADVEALAVVTPTPIASIDPEGPTMKLMGDRTDDVEAFKDGGEEAYDLSASTGKGQLLLAILNTHLSPLPFVGELNLGHFKESGIDEARDQWSHKYSRPEQVALLRAAGTARLSNRDKIAPRGLIFVSGDIHVGARFRISCADPAYEAWSLTASGINTVFDDPPTVDVLLSTDFEVAPGIRSELQEVVLNHNFGIVEVVPTGRGAEIQATVAHRGISVALGVDISLFL